MWGVVVLLKLVVLKLMLKKGLLISVLTHLFFMICNWSVSLRSIIVLRTIVSEIVDLVNDLGFYKMSQMINISISGTETEAQIFPLGWSRNELKVIWYILWQQFFYNKVVSLFIYLFIFWFLLAFWWRANVTNKSSSSLRSFYIVKKE